MCNEEESNIIYKIYWVLIYIYNYEGIYQKVYLGKTDLMYEGAAK